ncbi:potassium channel subfamily K member 17-like [Arapaima gigas]
MFSLILRNFLQRFSSMRLPSLLLMGVVYVAYVLIGGVVFWKLEGSQMKDTIVNIEETRSRLLRNLSCVSQEAFDNLTAVILQASKIGLSLKGNRTMDGFWKFTSSAVFAATVVTTIGYGNMSPISTYGQIFCVFFALFGIPLNVLVLNRVGKYMLLIEREFCKFIQTKTRHKKCVKVTIHSISCVFGIVIFFVVPMVVFSLEESWTYAQSIYYCFITLSTIGFGDYVADSNPDRVYPTWYSYLTAAWIFFGLAWLALLINHSIDILEGISVHFKQKRSLSSGSGGDSSDGAAVEAEGDSTKHEFPGDGAPDHVAEEEGPDIPEEDPSK